MKSCAPAIFINIRLLVYGLVLCVSTLPLSPYNTLASAAQPAPVVLENTDQEKVMLLSDQKKKSPADQSAKESAAAGDAEPETETEEGMSTLTKVGIGAGIAALAGVIALAGGSSSDSSPPPEPPTADQLVAPWNASAFSVENLSYTGIYHLYDGGALGYDLYFSDGRRKVGGGRWVVNGYRLTLYNDTGTIYSGEFAPENIISVRLDTTVGWTLDLTR